MIRIEVVNNLVDFARLERQWNSLLKESDQDEALVTHEFFYSWWEAFGNNDDMFVLLVWENEELIAIAPLVRRNLIWRGVNVGAIALMANLQSNRSGLIIRGSRRYILNEIFRFLKDLKIHFDIIQLNYILKDSNTEENITDFLRSSGFKYRTMPHNISPYIRIEQDWKGYLKTRSRNFKHKSNRLNNLYRRIKDYQVIKYSSGKIESAINEVFNISEKTWKHQKGTAIVSTEEEKLFYNSLAKRAAEKGWLNIWILKIGKRPVAYIFNLDYRRRIYSLKIGYDQAYAKYSPGEFLIFNAIQNSFDMGYHEYDWLGTNLPFKMKWTDKYRIHYNYWIFNKTIKGQLLAYLEILIISKLKRIKVFRNLYKKIQKSLKMRRQISRVI